MREDRDLTSERHVMVIQLFLHGLNFFGYIIIYYTCGEIKFE